MASGYLHVSSNLLKFTSIICEWFATWNLFFLISSYRFIDSSSNVIQIWLRNVKVSSIRTTFAAPSGSCFRRCSRIRISSWAWRWNLFSLRTCMTKTTNFFLKNPDSTKYKAPRRCHQYSTIMHSCEWSVKNYLIQTGSESRSTINMTNCPLYQLSCTTPKYTMKNSHNTFCQEICNESDFAKTSTVLVMNSIWYEMHNCTYQGWQVSAIGGLSRPGKTGFCQFLPIFFVLSVVINYVNCYDLFWASQCNFYLKWMHIF